MRRSLCPSQKGKNPSIDTSKRTVTSNNNNNKSNDDTVISRLPLFGFLEIPDNLNKQFILPAGQLCTKKNVELRKIRTLGPNKNFTNITTLSGNIFKPKPIIYDFNEEEDDGAEELPDENRPVIEPLVLWEDPNDSTNKIEVIYALASKLRPHQREGVQFLFECTMGLRGFDGQGCILADDMGLGKTLMSITLMWTLINQGMIKGEVAAKKIMVVCPTSLVGNWDNEIRKWVGDKCNVFAVKSDPRKMIKSFTNHRGKGVIIISYETQRRYETMFQPSKHNLGDAVSLLICDEAHKLKNADSGLSKSLSIIPAKKRILLSGYYHYIFNYLYKY
jgi:SNF2 family DNA or RNA helicase